MHYFVHYEGGSRHISGVFHKRDEGVEDEDVGQEHYHTAHTADYAVDEHILYRTVGHICADEVANQPYAGVYPVHRVLSDGESGPEHQPHYEYENRKSEQPACHNGVNHCRGFGLFLVLGVERFAERARHESVF